MKTLKLIHGYEIEIKDKKDVEKILRIFRDRLPLYFTQREDKASKEVVNNWDLVRKLVPNKLPKMPMDLYTMDDTSSEDNVHKLYIQKSDKKLFK